MDLFRVNVLSLKLRWKDMENLRSVVKGLPCYWANLTWVGCKYRTTPKNWRWDPEIRL